MCTAYEIGHRGGSFPSALNANAIETLTEIREPRLVRPTLSAPIILANGELQEMSWGFRRSFASKIKGHAPVMRTIVNSRADKLHRPMWAEAFSTHRCLIPAGSFYEWVIIAGRKRAMQFQRSSDEWLWIAGIWEHHAEYGDSFSMITTPPNDFTKAFHDRMPAVLADHEIPLFLAGKLGEFFPSSVALIGHEAPNFLKTSASKSQGSKPTPPSQDELF